MYLSFQSICVQGCTFDSVCNATKSRFPKSVSWLVFTWICYRLSHKCILYESILDNSAWISLANAFLAFFTFRSPPEGTSSKSVSNLSRFSSYAWRGLLLAVYDSTGWFAAFDFVMSKSRLCHKCKRHVRVIAIRNSKFGSDRERRWLTLQEV